MEVILFSYFTHIHISSASFKGMDSGGFFGFFWGFFVCFFFFLSALAVALTTGLGDLCTCT